MTLDWSDGAEAVYRQIAGHLREAIRRGEYEQGKLLPSEGRLSQQFDVSRDTIRDALKVLRAEGIVVTVRGYGTYVRAAVPEVTTVRVPPGTAVQTRPATPAERRRWLLPTGVPVLLVERSDGAVDVLPGDRYRVVTEG